MIFSTMGNPLRQPVLILHRRRWLAALYRWLQRGLWGALPLLLLLDLIHWYGRTVTISMIAGALLLPTGISLLWGLYRQRPQLNESARLTDRRLEAEDLLLSTWNQPEHPRGDDMMALVVHQALQRLPGWQARARQLPWPRPGVLLWAALLLLSAALTPLTLEREKGAVRPIAANSVPARPTTVPDNPLAEIVRQLPAPTINPASEGALWQPGGSMPRDSAPSGDRTDREQEQDARVLNITDPAANTTPSLATRPSGGPPPARPEAAAAEPGKRDTAQPSRHLERRFQDQAGNSADDGGGRVRQAAGDIELEQLALQRRSGRGDGELGRGKLQQYRGQWRTDAGTEAPPADGSSIERQTLNRYSPAQRAYIARYFQQLTGPQP